MTAEKPMQKEIHLSPDLPENEKRAIQQAAANLALSNMSPSEQAIRDAEAIAQGKKTIEQVIQETIRRYQK